MQARRQQLHLPREHRELAALTLAHYPAHPDDVLSTGKQFARNMQGPWSNTRCEAWSYAIVVRGAFELARHARPKSPQCGNAPLQHHQLFCVISAPTSPTVRPRLSTMDGGIDFFEIRSFIHLRTAHHLPAFWLVSVNCVRADHVHVLCLCSCWRLRL